MNKTVHIHQQYDKELESVRSRVLSMGGLVERQIGDAMTALRQSDTELAEYVIRTDHRVNAQEVNIDEDCTYILARRQPAAGDLRMVMAIIKTITDIERIGDESAKIAEMVVRDADNGVPADTSALMSRIEEMGQIVAKMLNSALDAFLRMDVESALATARMDLAVDQLYSSLLTDMVEQVKNDPEQAAYYQNLTWVIRSLERIGDHGTNICEYVIYLVKGRDIRHTSIEDIEKEIIG